MRLIAILVFEGVALWSASLRGSVSDPSGSRIANATLELLDQETLISSATTTLSGSFELAVPQPGSFMLRVAAPGFREHWQQVDLSAGPMETFHVILPAISPVRADITVTARRGAVEDAGGAPQMAASVSSERLQFRRLQTVGHALDGNPGIVVQETTSAQSSPVLRGLTGHQTLLLIDGVRLNTSIFRSGPNQYIALVHPSQTERIEAVLGPAGATFGSDSMGGTINMTSRAPAGANQRERWLQGEISVFASSSDLAVGWDTHLFGRHRTISYAFAGFTQRNNDLRTGHGGDSRNSFRRYFNLDSAAIQRLIGERLPATASTRDGAYGRADWRATASQSLSMWYQHDTLAGVRSYRDQLGGPGNLVSRIEPQALDFGYIRYQKMRVGFFDSVSATFSVNAQQDGSVKQALRWTDTVTTDRNDVAAYGYSVQATGHAGGRQAFTIGSETYLEHVNSTRFVYDPGLSRQTQQRAQYPDGSRYKTFALYLQDTFEPIRSRLRLTAGLRYSWIRFAAFADRNRDASGNSLGVPDSQRTFSDFAFNTAASWQMTQRLSVHAAVARGFRAPNLNDLGSVGAGMTTLGYEFPAEEAIPLKAQFALDSSDTSGTSGRLVSRLRPESLYNYETGLALRAGRFYARAQIFDAELVNPITARTMLFAAGSIPTMVGGMSVTPLPQSAIQQQHGVFAVATSLTPRAVKSTVNDGHTKYYGGEGILQLQLSPRWTANVNYGYLVGRDLNPNRPVRRLPPQHAAAVLRYVPTSRRVWLEFAAQAAGAQERLNGGDIDDDRIGASRRRSDIASFFGGGVVAPMVSVGADGERGTVDDVFQLTGETLLQIQNRVLPVGAVINGVRVASDGVRVPLYVRHAGWFAVAVHGGAPLGHRASVSFALTNLFDRNYRVYGSGVDAAGRGAFLALKYTF
jgi:hemoglobin/transferrin/lactoferrin receptor protein